MGDQYIVVRLMGGLGNQLFQYAAGLLQSKVTHGKLYLEKPVENLHDTHDYRSTLFTFGEKYDSELSYHISHYQENGFAFWNPNDYNYSILRLYGYFQNYTSLKPILPEFKQHILGNLKCKIPYNVIPNSGFIHVRRGDYLKNSIELKNMNYYTEAISLNKHIDTWYIFSDDIAWCKNSKLFDAIHTIYVEETDPVVCLALMSEIKDSAIIANSTFSWMGAYLGCGTKNVIYPKTWIGTGTPDLFPEEWIGL